MKRLTMLLILITSLLLVGCGATFSEQYSVKATVSNLKHIEKKDYVIFHFDDESKSYEKETYTMPDTYFVTVSYDNTTATFNNQQLYNSVKVGDTIHISVYK